MADTKISGLTADASPTSDDLIVTVTDPGGTPASRKVTLASLNTLIRSLSGGGLQITEAADHPATPTAGLGQLWVSNDATQKLYFTDDAGTDREILDSSSGTTLTAATILTTDALPFFDASDSDNPKQTTVSDFIADLDLAENAVTENAQTGTTYTLVLADASKWVSMNNASANTLTIPANASVAFPVGTVIVVQQKGAGATTITGATGVTVNGVSAGTGDVSAQWGAVTLFKSATDTWYAAGAIGTVA